MAPPRSIFGFHIAWILARYSTWKKVVQRCRVFIPVKTMFPLLVKTLAFRPANFDNDLLLSVEKDLGEIFDLSSTPVWAPGPVGSDSDSRKDELAPCTDDSDGYDWDFAYVPVDCDVEVLGRTL